MSIKSGQLRSIPMHLITIAFLFIDIYIYIYMLDLQTKVL